MSTAGQCGAGHLPCPPPTRTISGSTSSEPLSDVSRLYLTRTYLADVLVCTFAFSKLSRLKGMASNVVCEGTGFLPTLRGSARVVELFEHPSL